MTYKPLHANVLAEEIDEQKAGSIVSTQTKGMIRAKAIAVGAETIDDDGKLRTPDVKVGDIIHFDKEEGLPITLDNKDYLIIHNGYILLIEQP